MGGRKGILRLIFITTESTAYGITPSPVTQQWTLFNIYTKPLLSEADTGFVDTQRMKDFSAVALNILMNTVVFAEPDINSVKQYLSVKY